MRKLVLVAAILLNGCAARMISANEAGGIVSVEGSLSAQSKAMAVADAHCRKYGKVARYKGLNEIRASVSFDCVAP